MNEAGSDATRSTGLYRNEPEEGRETMTDLTKNSIRTQEERGAVHPILFQPPMVRALIAGTKTQTRRLLKPQPPADSGPLTWTAYHPTKVDRHGEEYPGPLTLGASSEDGSFATPIRITPGDRLWVREAWRADEAVDVLRPRDMSPALPICYEADRHERESNAVRFKAGKLRPSMFMPRWASRLTLAVTDVRVQRLLEISRDDAIAEGLTQLPASGRWVVERGDQYFGLADHDPRSVYSMLWERINGEGSSFKNPWVVAYSFRVERRNIDAAP
jgi:hypothetical protein